MVGRMTSYSPEHWRSRAEATRIKAETCHAGNIRDKLLRVVAEYEQLARRAERWQPTKVSQVTPELPAGNWQNPVGGRKHISGSTKLALVYVNPSVLREGSN
jgi:hypothetical protein